MEPPSNMNFSDTRDNGLQLHYIAATMVVDSGSSNLGGNSEDSIFSVRKLGK